MKRDAVAHVLFAEGVHELWQDLVGDHSFREVVAVARQAAQS